MPSRCVPLRRVPLSQVRDLAIKTSIVEVASKSCCQTECRFLKQIKGVPTLLQVMPSIAVAVAVAVAVVNATPLSLP